MGTNYYVDWNPGGNQSGGPASMNYPQPTVNMHICKSMTSFQGSVFNSWSAWKNFLTRNEWQLKITDEYGSEHAVADFIEKVESVSDDARRSHYRWMVEHGRELDRDWLCPDGFSFYAGEFS